MAFRFFWQDIYVGTPKSSKRFGGSQISCDSYHRIIGVWSTNGWFSTHSGNIGHLIYWNGWFSFCWCEETRSRKQRFFGIWSGMMIKPGKDVGKWDCEFCQKRNHEHGNLTLLVLNAGNGWEWGVLGLLLIVIVDHSRKFPHSLLSPSKTNMNVFWSHSVGLSCLASDHVVVNYDCPGDGWQVMSNEMTSPAFSNHRPILPIHSK